MNTAKKIGRNKRGNGEGSIYQRKDGLWVGAVSLPDGKRKTVYGKTRQEAAKKMTAVLKDAQTGLPVPTGRKTLGVFLTDYLSGVKPTIRPSTYRSYEQLTRVHLMPALGKLPLADVTPAKIQAMLAGKLDDGLAPRSVQRIHAVLRQALNQAVAWNLLPRNPALYAKPPKVERFDAPIITIEDARAILGAVKGDRLAALVTVGLSLGLRLGEATGLRWEDVDLDRGTLKVRGQVQRIGGTLTLVDTKTNQSRRTLSMPPVVVESLRAHRVQQLEARLAAGARWQERGLVFCTTLGTPLDGPKVTRRFQRLLGRAGLPRLRFHDLRHGHASLLLAQGVDRKTVSDLLGHSQIGITANLYAHVAPALKLDAAAKMQAALAGAL
jgi:integrase